MCTMVENFFFFHIIDIVLVSGYILFQSHRKNNPDNELLKRPQIYCLHNFREEVVWSLAELEEYGIPKLDQWKPPSIEPSFYETAYTKIFNSKKKLKSLLQRHKTRTKKIESYCSPPQCSVYLH